MTAQVTQPTTASAPVTRKLATGLLQTEVEGAPERGYTWRRRNGPLAPRPFVVDDGALRELIGSLDTVDTVRWSPAEAADGELRVYHARGPEAVAGRLLRDGPDAELARTMRGLGSALRQLHEQPVPHKARLSRRPRGLDRFDDWLAGRSPSPRAGYAESFLRPRVGDEGLTLLRELSAGLEGRPADANTVLSHGAPTLGGLIPRAPSNGGGEADMLIGEDLCLAPWQFDVGWTLGELVELNWLRRADDRAAWSAVLEGFFEGYGRDLDDAWRRHASLRVLLHMHDYTAYVEWNPWTVEKYIGFARFLLGV